MIDNLRIANGADIQLSKVSFDYNLYYLMPWDEAMSAEIACERKLIKTFFLFHNHFPS